MSIAAYSQPSFGPDLVTVTAEAPDRRTGYANVNIRVLRCKIGDLVKATEQGLALKIQPETCKRPTE
ncbi:hypothetical protein M9980_00130 [Sphingomonas donggukensis]|uniref:Uncharacterized protein n=1 Tax=Sphingomonas donggukensis TaxID=2949093 RepID=A0ABY4TTF8_9SPHN|nr:hypothetical protein [Sphingomonas donggukensis]URW75683.1 hypothetical protein M9980_00130 [Sphingomonas donggukensis]